MSQNFFSPYQDPPPFNLQCSQSTNANRSFSVLYADLYDYTRTWYLPGAKGDVDTRIFCSYQSWLGIDHNVTQDSCDEDLSIGLPLQTRPWAGCYADVGQVPFGGQGYNPNNPAYGSHENTWCWLWEDSYTCNVIIDKLLNEQEDNLRNMTKQDLVQSLGNIGCSPIVDANGRTKTNCKFENPNGNYTHSSRPRLAFYDQSSFPYTRRFNPIWSATCNVAPTSITDVLQALDTNSDYRYKPLCCSLNNVREVSEVMGANFQSQTDPITGNPVSPLMCDESWCLDDPLGSCRTMFTQLCTGTSSCHRHNYLSTYNPLQDISALGYDPMAFQLLLQLSVSGYAPLGPQPFGGLPCNAYYKKTEALSRSLVYFFNTDLNVTLLRIQTIQEQVQQYCTDPAYNGNGECGCLRGYQSLGAGFTPNVGPSGLGGPLPEQTSITYFSVPSGIKNFSHRVDLYCDPNSSTLPAFLGELSYSTVVNETSCTGSTPPENCITFSNACSSFTRLGVDQYPLLGGLLGKTYPTLNPMQSILSSTNYGDVIAQTKKVPVGLYGAQPETRNPFAIPYRCWLPACVDPNVTEVVFNDLLQNSPCPDVCYAYGGSEAIDLTNVNANVISMGNFVNQCNYDGNSSTVNVEPLILPSLLSNGFQFDVPQGYTGSLTFNVFNSEYDVSQVASSKTVNIFTDIPFYLSVTQDVTLLYKYDYVSVTKDPYAHDSISVTLTVNAQSTTPAYYQLNMYLRDSNLGQMQIPITLNIFSTLSNPASESNWPRACAFYGDSTSQNLNSKCHAVDCFFGSNSVLTNAVLPPGCSGGLNAINFTDFFDTSRHLIQTGLSSTDGVPYAVKIKPPSLPITNYRNDPTLSLYNENDLTSLGYSQLLQTHVQLYGNTLQTIPLYQQNPRYNLVG